MPISDLDGLLESAKATALRRTRNNLMAAIAAAESGTYRVMLTNLRDALQHAEEYQAYASLEAAWTTIKPRSSN